MNVRAIRNIDLSPMPAKPERVAPQRLVLTPIPWGKRDRHLAHAVCQQILESTPPLLIPFQPITHARTRRFLRSHGVHC